MRTPCPRDCIVQFVLDLMGGNRGVVKRSTTVIISYTIKQGMKRSPSYKILLIARIIDGSIDPTRTYEELV